MKINRMDHVGINVIDIKAAKEFFLDLGLEVVGEQEIEGEWVGRIIGLEDVKDKIVMMQTPGGQAQIELVQFYKPLDEKGIQPSFSNTLGIRHICFEVEDVEGIVSKVKKKGYEIVGEIHKYEELYKLCY